MATNPSLKDDPSEGCAAKNGHSQQDLFLAPLKRAPVMWAWGVGVDSTAGIIEMHSRGEPIDMVLNAYMPEKRETHAFRETFMAWMREREIPCKVVSYEPKRFKNFPRYSDLLENCLTNGTLPSIAFGFSSCSQKWKVAPQDAWAKTWAPAVQAWDQGMKVVKCIGYDAGGRDSKRYAHAEGHTDDRYEYRYPLREWGWDREKCEARITEELGFAPPKSSCFFCSAMKIEEVTALSETELRLIVLMEARAAPRLRNIDGLWRKPVKGARGGTPRPGSMTQFIREQRLLPEKEIDTIINECPTALITWQEAHADKPLEARPALSEWIDFFARHAGQFRDKGVRDLYGEPGAKLLRDRLDQLDAVS